MKALASLVILLVLVVVLDVAAIPATGYRNIAHEFPYPIQGLEHVVALFGIGILASRYAGLRMGIMPVACVLLFAAGLSVGMLNPTTLTQPAEIVVVFSTLISVVMVVSGRCPRLALAVPAFGFLALVHGYAHGIRISSEVNAVRYSRELVSAVAIVLLAGLLAGTAFRLLHRGWSEQKADGPHETPQ